MQFGQYQGAGALIGFGLLLRHPAHRKRLPFTAVFGRVFFPVLSLIFDIPVGYQKDTSGEAVLLFGRILNPLQ
jgi:hypothetical protein